MVNAPKLPATIRIHECITADTFGCDEQIFKKYVEGQQLAVIKKLNSFYLVNIAGITHPVHESEISKNNIQ